MRRAWLIIVIFLIIPNSPVNASWPVNFLEDEAGMAAYFRFTGPTNLQSNLLRNLYRTITIDKADYLVGWVPMEGYEPYPVMDLKLFIHNDGWVVAYVPIEKPPAVMFNTYVDQINRLDRILERVADAIEVTDYELHYADFQHPEATRLTTIEMRAAGTRPFDFRLPGTSQFFVRSYYIYAPGMFTSVSLWMDGKQVVSVGNGINAGGFTDDQLVTNAKHAAELRAPLSAGYFGMMFVYNGQDDPVVNGVDSLHFYDIPEIPIDLMETAKDVPFYLDTYLPAIMR